MTRFFSRASVIALLALLTLAPLASAKKRDRVIIYYQTSSSPIWYEVATEERTSPPVYTYTVPATSNKVYIYKAEAPRWAK